MMATMFLTMALYYFLLLLKKTKSIYVILFNLFSFLAMFTFYGCGFFIVGMIMGSYFVKRKRLNYPFFLSIGLLFSLLLLSPLLLRQFVNAKMGLSEVKNWSLVLGKAEIKNFAMVFLKFSTGRLSWYPKWSYYLIAGVPTAITWVFIAFGMRRNKLLAFLLFFPLCVGYIISFVTPMMMYFRFLYLIPVMSVLLAMGVFSTSQKFARNDLKGMMIFLLLLFFSLIYLLNPQFHREDWKNLTQNIDPLQPVYMILPSSDPVGYYNSELSLFEIREISKSALPEYIQVIPYVEELYGYNHTEVLEQKGCIRETISEYRGPLFLEKWKCAKILSSR